MSQKIPDGKLGEIYEALDEAEKADYLAYLGDRRSCTAEQLARVLRRLGYSVSPSLIRTYRREKEAYERVEEVSGREQGSVNPGTLEGGVDQEG